MASDQPIGASPVNNRRRSYFALLVFSLFVILAAILTEPQLAAAQAMPYAGAFPKSKEEVAKALNELQAYSGQKLPIVEGFVALGDQPLDRYERAFYQFSIELLPGNSVGTIVRLTAKITAWYADRDPAKSGYHVLPSNGRLELDLLDRLTEKLGGKPVAASKSDVQAPKPKIDLSSAVPRTFRPSSSPSPATSQPGTAPALTDGEVSSLRVKRETEEARVRELNSTLQGLQEIERNQAYPDNLVVIGKSGAPVLARPAEGSRVLFTAAADDEFEFLDAERDWIHVQISGASRGYVHRSNLELPELFAAHLKSQNGNTASLKQEVFKLASEETSAFPADWDPLRGKSVRIYTVQPVSPNAKGTAASAKLNFAASLFEKFALATPHPAGVQGVVVIFDSADGGIVAATLANIEQLANASLSPELFWKESYLEPREAFQLDKP